MTAITALLVIAVIGTAFLGAVATLFFAVSAILNRKETVPMPLNPFHLLADEKAFTEIGLQYRRLIPYALAGAIVLPAGFLALLAMFSAIAN